MMRGCEPGDLHIEPSFILGDNAFENTRCDRTRDLAPVARGALHHHGDYILGMVEWRETRKPSHVFLAAMIGGLRRAGLPSHDHICQTRSAAGSSVFIDDFPQTAPNEFEVLR